MFEKYNPKKHEWRGSGWRHHVPIYIGIRKNGRIETEIKCSERSCEVNAKSS